MLTVEFELNGSDLLVGNGGNGIHAFWGRVVLMVPCKDFAEIDYYWKSFLPCQKPNNVAGVKIIYLSWQIIPANFDEPAKSNMINGMNETTEWNGMESGIPSKVSDAGGF